MNLTEAIKVAISALGANKLRASLTMLGMIIGVGSVIALMSIGQGMQAGVQAQIGSLGSNLLFISPGSTQQNGVRTQAGSAQTLTAEDANALAESIAQIAAVAPEAASFGQVVANGQNTNTRIIGVTPEYLDVRSFELAAGEYVSAEHVTGRSLVAVLGSTTAETLFSGLDAIGQTIRVNNVSLRVIGVLEAKGSSASGNQDDAIYAPLTTVQTRLNRARTATGGNTVSQIYVQLADGAAATKEAAVQAIGALLRERHKVSQDDFTVRSQDDLLATATQVAGFITLFLGAVAGISLVVGGIGIMNIMLVSVTERTREIGIRKAIGATRGNILSQFLIEATVVSVAGGAIGILLGGGGSRLLNGITLTGLSTQPIQTVVASEAIVLSFVVSAAIGLFFGVYPAFKASRLNPIQALRHE